MQNISKFLKFKHFKENRFASISSTNIKNLKCSDASKGKIIEANFHETQAKFQDDPLERQKHTNVTEKPTRFLIKFLTLLRMAYWSGRF